MKIFSDLLSKKFFQLQAQAMTEGNRGLKVHHSFPDGLVLGYWCDEAHHAAIARRDGFPSQRELNALRLNVPDGLNHTSKFERNCGIYEFAWSGNRTDEVAKIVHPSHYGFLLRTGTFPAPHTHEERWGYVWFNTAEEMAAAVDWSLPLWPDDDWSTPQPVEDDRQFLSVLANKPVTPTPKPEQDYQQGTMFDLASSAPKHYEL